MSSGEPEYQSHDYIADRERQAYVEAGGVQANQQMQSEGFFGSVSGWVHRSAAQAHAAQVADNYGHQQARTLSQNHELRSKPAELGTTNYHSYPHSQLTGFVRDNFEPASVHDVGRIYHGHGKKMIEFATDIQRAADKTQEKWQGSAGDSMRNHMRTVADHMGYSGEATQLTANQMGLQAESAEHARNSMPEDPEFDLKAELTGLALNPNPFTMADRVNEIQQKAEQAQKAHDEAARVVSTMETGFGQAAANTPKFTPPPPSPDESGSAPVNPGSGPSVGGLVSPGSGSAPAATYSASASPTPSSTVSPPSSGASYTPSGGYTSSGSQAPASTSSSWASSNNGLPPGTVRGPDGTIYRQGPNGQWMRQNAANGRWAPVPPGHQVPGVGRVGGGAPGAGRGGGRVPGGGYGGGSFGPGGNGNQPLSQGGRSGGARPPAPAPSSTTGASSTSNSSSRGMGRMPMGAGGQNQQGGEEEEHENEYVLKTDEIGEDLDLPRVAPPVIGALPDEEGGENQSR